MNCGVRLHRETHELRGFVYFDTYALESVKETLGGFHVSLTAGNRAAETSAQTQPGPALPKIHSFDPLSLHAKL